MARKKKTQINKKVLREQMQFWTDIANAAQEFLDDEKQIKKDISTALAEQYEADLNEIARLCIKKFYDDYKPKFYRRKYSLYHAYRILNNGGVIDIEYSHEFMLDTHKHRVDKKYIFEKVFNEGWHGGAHTISSENAKLWGAHPDNKTPFWRILPPYNKEGIKPYITGWHKEPAKKTIPPRHRIETEIGNYISNKPNILKKTKDEAYKTNHIWNDLYKKYRILSYKKGR